MSRGLTLSDDDLLRKQIIMQLICQFRLILRQSKQQQDYFSQSTLVKNLCNFRTYGADGLIQIRPARN